ncbi:hypothetical protein BU23DRAFT_467686 [Bimuria novae-zelandiae CBS 107.79]|uniref:HTH CENPB-type domain-containing protein n=1 Tax=Bimuria novae-zelandiae CBS 107.79 TaxID=1447943 RepID=A0A6A5V6S5_9PLEO|nr:hypothetical protein BU23DRAFT_467686 [Bimuria novae-zelandiae CBS 107.79]
MAPIDDALAEIDSLDPSDKLCYTKIANEHGVERLTLSRRHRALTPQQEAELIKYIKGLIARYLLPIRKIIRNFALIIAKKLAASINSNYYNANLGNKYSLYFNFLRNKIKEYNIKPCYIYNIDEKGCLISIVSRLKWVFSR